MKKLKYLLALVVMFGFVATVNATESSEPVKEGPFYFNWENDVIADAIYEVPIVSDNFAFKDGSVVIRTLVDEVNQKQSIELERRDSEGKVVKESIIEDSVFYSAITDSNNIYIVTQKIATNTKSRIIAPIQNVLKLDENLNVVKELVFEEEYTPGVDGMMNARIFGHDILAIRDNSLYVFCGEKYMLKTSLDLDKWENMPYTKEDFTKYFPDLSKEYDLMDIWMDEITKGQPPMSIDIWVTTHIYENNTLTSGAVFEVDDVNYTTTMKGILRITDNEGNVTLDVTSDEYAKFIEARIMGDYVIAIGLQEASIMGNQNSTQLGNDIVIYNMKGEVVQTIETEGSYLFLNETNNGFIATHVESCKDITIEGATENQPKTERVCSYNTEEYYLPLSIETKVNGEGAVDVIRSSRKGQSVMFSVKPAAGYSLSSVRVTDASGNVLVFNDYTFTMPSANVTIEAIFVPKNPDTYDNIVISIFIGIVSLGGLVATSRYLKKKKINA